jgi:hypothetical protein
VIKNENEMANEKMAEFLISNPKKLTISPPVSFITTLPKYIGKIVEIITNEKDEFAQS